MNGLLARSERSEESQPCESDSLLRSE